jgi:L-fuculose-phosphate aldolase
MALSPRHPEEPPRHGRGAALPFGLCHDARLPPPADPGLPLHGRVAGGTTIRCADYATFGTQALSDAALRALEGRTACLLGQHGQIALGRTSMEKALWLATEVETLSRIYVQALPLGEPPVLDDDEMARVIAQMERMSYGQGPETEGSNDIARPRGTAG